ncbi:site-specific DNA-methyltransferase [Nitrosophilus labii]|uniref:site-specific DNA-methyltransferase n=1 Tax=Nitrosophilus labii TaxID=2706014 RepID=UPI001656E7DF|nr:site-specific DNA-methyltransferase [Nitrosophilus labii]
MRIEKIEQTEAVLNEIETLKKYFPQYFDKNGKFLIEKFKASIEKSTDISKESFSLEWLGKTYSRVLTHEPARTFIKENMEWNVKEENKNSQNLLIKGDNLEVLKHMVNAYEGEIKMVYIDPPYNTGDDGFVYHDNRQFRPDELAKLAGIDIEKAKRILDFINSKSNSHSAWLTFMYPRLYIAKNLLANEGSIFISIDDNEYAQLKLLTDEIFGEENFICTFVWQKNFAPKNDNKYISISHEYILCYAKNKEKFERNLLPREDKHNKDYKNPDNDPRGPWTSGSMLATTFSEKGVFPIVSPNGKEHWPPKGRCWRYSQNKIEELIKDNRIWFGKDGNGVPRVKRFLFEMPSGIVPQSWLPYTLAGSGQDGSQEVKSIFDNKVVFPFPKPTKLIKYFIQIATNSSDIILDFFAGSGTTGDAVMQLNAEDGGDRKYILVQLPEPIDPKKNKTAYEFVKNELGLDNPTIFDITKERLVRSSKKVVSDKEKEIQEIQEKISKVKSKEKRTTKDESKLIELKEILDKKKQELDQIKSMDLGFKIFETINIPKELLEDIEELRDNLLLPKDIDTDTLLTTWKLYDGSKLTQKPIKIDLEGYTAYLVDSRLYLLNSRFTTDNLAVMLKKIDEDNSFAPSKIVANGYALSSKAQRELYEGILNFVNKKHIELEFIVRY